MDYSLADLWCLDFIQSCTYWESSAHVAVYSLNPLVLELSLPSERMPTAGYALDLFTPKLEEDDILPTRPARDHSLATAEMMRPRSASSQGERSGQDPLISETTSAVTRRAVFGKLPSKYSELSEWATPHTRNGMAAKRAPISPSPASSRGTRLGGHSELSGHSNLSRPIGHRATNARARGEHAARHVTVDRESYEATPAIVAPPSPPLPPPTRSCLATEGVDAALLARALLAASDATAYLNSEAHAKALERVSNAAASESPEHRAEHRAALRSGARRNAQHRRLAENRAAANSERMATYSPAKRTIISPRSRNSISLDRPSASGSSLSLSPSPRKQHRGHRHTGLQVQPQTRSSPPLSPSDLRGQHLLRSPSPGADRAGALLEHHQRLVRLLDDGKSRHGDGDHDSASRDNRGSRDVTDGPVEISAVPAVASSYPVGRPASSLKSPVKSSPSSTKMHSPAPGVPKPWVHAPQQPQEVHAMLRSAQAALEGLATPVSPRRATTEEERETVYEALSPVRLQFHPPLPLPLPQEDSTTPTGSPPRRSPNGSMERQSPTPPRPAPLKPPPIPPPPRSSATASASERFI